MLDSFIKLVIGDLEGKKAYQQFKKRVGALPEDYRFAFRSIQNYLYSVGPENGDITVFTDMKMFTSLLELLETGAAQGKHVADVIGDDVGGFCDEFMRSFTGGANTRREKLNKEIMEKFEGEGR